ncbi:MAG: cytochrome P450 [Ardenticatenaceae bacterium]|nr:cytochrome P450 [Ardenticatenaceae bacterium]HBY93360.1 hypothetical protein [Chloroflexota bacterium]
MASAHSQYREFENVDPFPFYEELRQVAPRYDESTEAWLFTSYEQCAFILRRGDLFRRVDSVLPNFDRADGNGIKGTGRKLEMLDLGEEHDVLHKYLVNLLSTEVATSYRTPVIRPIVERLIDRFAGRGRAELGEALADKVPMYVTAAFLGVTREDDEMVERIRRLRRDIARWQESQGAVPEDLEIGTRAAVALRELLMRVVRERKKQPRDDLVSEMWRSGPLPGWGEDDVVLQCMGYFGGATETQQFLRNLIYVLLTRPDLHARLRADRDVMIPRFVEETLRCIGVVHWQPRVARRDITLGGVPLKRGDRVVAIFAAANRDPQRYRKPAEIDLDSEEHKGHLAFGLGPRFCIGSAIARAQGYEVVDALLARLRKLRLDGQAEAPHLRAFHVRSFAPLYALFDSDERYAGGRGQGGGLPRAV